MDLFKKKYTRPCLREIDPSTIMDPKIRAAIQKLDRISKQVVKIKLDIDWSRHVTVDHY